ncbi:dnaJ homolog subfamily A member 3, mitochondrial-like [Saccostrea echinata]|uniref:dnaJ homolog subfamily A member 3, mitochondrial-like n=1 Tax=Saccostrea echinata TaxID=191078 RepID=UPI002A7F4D3C|nr:dnaJ homolog subfamily A member 3, mitochondrial-like [Saccostrea echinata]XP_061172112.1 dnaJ homolog subfamily A member 3, mitochondrial-like [Saccostrea echinata]
MLHQPCLVKGSLHTHVSSCRLLLLRHYSPSLSRTHYEVLGVQKQASAKEIRAAYIELCKKYHPDANPGDPQAQQKFVQLQEAYNVLNDPRGRAEYDIKINKQHYRTTYSTQYTRSAGNTSEDDFVRNYYKRQSRAPPKSAEDIYRDWVKQTQRQEEMYDEMIRRNQEKRRQAYEDLYKEFHQYSSRGNTRSNPWGDYRTQQKYYHYHSSPRLGNIVFSMFWLYISIKLLILLIIGSD